MISGWLAPHVRLGCVRHANMSWFSRVSFGHLFCIFPSSFLSSVFFLIQFSVLRVYLSFKLLFSILHFLVSPSCFFFFSNSSMVEYSTVRADCPSITFIFTHLGSLLESVEGERLERISSFVGGLSVHFCPFFFVSFSFPFR